MTRHILVPLDGSAFSETALPMALDLARRTAARLHLVQVHEPPAAPAYPDAVPAYDERWDGALRAREEEYLRSLAHRCMERAGVSPVTQLLDGPVAGALASYVAEVGIDRIIMTTHGRGGISRAWMGSVADALVRRAAVPMLLIRPKQDRIDWDRVFTANHILIPLDGSVLSEGILDSALELGGLSGAQYTLLRVVLPLPFVSAPYAAGPSFNEAGAAQSRDNAAQYLDSVAQRLRERGVRVDTGTIFHTSPAIGILDYAATHSVDAIAMATHGRGGWSRVALGSVADKVLRGTMMPVLLYRPPARPLMPPSAGDDAVAAAVTMDEPSTPA
jgi:nucleotide-binding universal stress UspA family protein